MNWIVKATGRGGELRSIRRRQPWRRSPKGPRVYLDRCGALYSEQNGLPVRRMLRRFSPRLRTTLEVLGRRGALGSDQCFECRQPMLIIRAAEIGIAERARTGQLPGECLRPFGPVTLAFLVQSLRHGEGPRFPRFVENRTAGILR